VTVETRLEVRVTPRAATTDVRVEDATIRIRVTAAPVEGAANAAAIDALAAALHVPVRTIRLVTGARGRRKVLGVEGLDRAAIDLRLAGTAGRRARPREVPSPGRRGLRAGAARGD